MKSYLLSVLMVITSLAAFAQTGSISGAISTTNGSPLPNATVTLSGTKYQTVTDADGHFYFTNLPGGSYTIVATSVNYTAKSQPVTIVTNKPQTLTLQLNERTNTLDEVTVRATQRLAIANTSSITRTATPAKDLPQSVQSVNRTLINDQQLYRVDEALKNVAGVNLSSSYGSYNFRGFITNSGSFLTNGMRGSLFPEGVSNTLANVERIEVLRGPSAILYGENAVGGNINFVTKQPKKTTNVFASATAGSFGLFRTQADVTGSINKSKSLYYVTGFGLENGGRFTKDWKHFNTLLFGALKWELTPKTSWQLNANYNYDNSTSNYSPDLPFLRGNLFSTPVDFNYQGEDAKLIGNSYQLQSQFRHQFNTKWSANLLAGYSRTDAKRTHYSIGDYVNPATDKLERSKSRSRMTVPVKTLNAYTTGSIGSGRFRNTVTAGFDYTIENGTYPEGFEIWAADSISISAPDRKAFIPAPGFPDFYYSSYEKFIYKTWGGYVQNQFAIGQMIKGVLGFRYNWYNNNYRADSVSYNNFETYEEINLNTTALIPRLGLVFQPIKTLSIYADYNSGFQPQYANNRTSGGPFDPETTNQFEVGIKGEFAQGRLVPTLAVYHINKNNVLTPDLNDPNGLLLTTIGQVRSKGVEATLTGSFGNWNIVYNYAINKTTITESNDPDEIGQIFDNSPRHISSIWTSYLFTEGGLKGLKLGFGNRNTSDRFIRDRKTTATNIDVLPSYTVADVLVQYNIKRFTLGYNLNNVFNERYIQGSFWSRSVFPGTPRTHLLSLSYSFKS